jgi:hypothetical protein
MVYVGTLYTWNTWWQPGLAAFFESFMMPMFCACSGYLSKGTPSPDRCLRVLFRAWVPFVIVNVFYEWIDNGFGPSGLRGTYTNLLNSLEVSWFLCCWIQWRLLLPYICALPPSVAITVSYMLSWFSGYWFDSEPTFHQDEVRSTRALARARMECMHAACWVLTRALVCAAAGARLLPVCGDGLLHTAGAHPHAGQALDPARVGRLLLVPLCHHDDVCQGDVPGCGRQRVQREPRQHLQLLLDGA